MARRKSSGADGRRVRALTVGIVVAAMALTATAPAVGAATSRSGLTSDDWTASTLPMPGNADANGNNNNLMGISCSSVTQCAAVGSYPENSGPNVTAPVVLNMSGTTWVAQQAPTPVLLTQFTRPRLVGVSCPSESQCFGVGTYFDGGNQGMVLAWDGSSWSAAQAPVPADASPNPGIDLYGVSCATTSSCIATGQYQDNLGNQRGLLLTWSGQEWTASAAPPLPGVKSNGFVVSALMAVSCASPDACFTGGYIQDRLGNLLPYLVGWSDGEWHPVQVTLPPDAAKGKTNQQQAMIKGLSCASATDCVAIGFYNDTSGNEQGLLLTWNGDDWTSAKAPLPADAGSNPWVELNGVSCPTAVACYVAGTYEDSDSQPFGLILQGAGSSWEPVASLTATYNLAGISCPAADQCFAVGQQPDSDPILVTGPGATG